MIMKSNNIFNSFAALVMGFALVMTSCQPEGPEEEPATVSFPEYKEYTVAPGDKVTISFEAETDWEVTVPDNTLQWFWIQDGSFELYRINGKAGSNTVEIGVSETEEFDNDRTCIVKMTMGGETKEIAKITRPSENRTLTVSAAQVIDGEVQFTEDGSSYLYEDGESSSLELVWSGSEFRLPVKVTANFNWTYSGPDWLRMDVPENGVKENEIILYGVPSEYPLENAAAELEFMSGDELIKKYDVMIPGCRDIFSYRLDMNMTEIQFNFKGQFKASTGFVGGDDAEDGEVKYPTGTFFGTSDVRVLTLSKTEEGYSAEMPSWLDVVFDEYDTTEGASVLQERSLTVKAGINEGEDREAAIFILPPSVTASAGELYSDKDVKEEYVQYMIPVTQLSSDQEFVAMIANPSDMAAAGATFNVSEDPDLYALFGTSRYAYELVYTDRYAMDHARMMFASPVTSFKTFDADKNEITFKVAKVYTEAQETAKGCEAGTRIDVLADEYDDAGNVLYAGGLYEVTESGSLKGISYADHFLLSISLDEDMMGGVIDMKAEVHSEGYVVLYGETDNVLAVIKCTLDPEVIIEEVEDVKFIGESIENSVKMGATLEKLTEGSIYNQYRDGNALVYHLTYTQEDAPMTISIPASIVSHDVNPFPLRHNIRVNDQKYDEDPSVKLIDGGVTIYMDLPEGSKRIRGNINFRRKASSSDDSGLVLVLVCTIDINETAE